MKVYVHELCARNKIIKSAEVSLGSKFGKKHLISKNALKFIIQNGIEVKSLKDKEQQYLGIDKNELKFYSNKDDAYQYSPSELYIHTVHNNDEKVITHVGATFGELTTKHILDVDTIVFLINNGVSVKVGNSKGVKVHVVEDDYIRTNPDNCESNNLDELPELTQEEIDTYYALLKS